MMFFRNFSDTVEMKGEGGLPTVVEDYDGSPQQRQHMGGFLSTKQHHDSHQALQQKPESYSDEVDSRSDDGGAVDTGQRHQKRQRKSTSLTRSAAPPAPPVGKAAGGGGGGEDGSTVEAAKRPRGRPPGAKNKPKPPVVITRGVDDTSSPATMRPHVLEVAVGQDVVDALASFSRRRNLGLCVLAGTGLVSNVVLRHPLTSHSPPRSPNLSFPGHFEILSISATFLPPSFAPSSPLALWERGGGVSVSLAGPHGHVLGGLVVGPLTAARTVTVLAAAFGNPTYHRLPADDEVSVSVSVSVSGSGDVEAPRAQASQAPRHQRQQHNTLSRHQQQQHHHPHQQHCQKQRSTSPPSSSSAAAASQPHPHSVASLAASTAAEVSGMSIYGCHLSSDVIWAPAARSPPY